MNKPPPFHVQPQELQGAALPGAPVGLGGQAGRPRILGATPQAAAQYSPQLALAIAQGVPFAPYLLNVRSSFTDPATTILQPATLENGQTRIIQPSVCDGMFLHIDAPNNFPGTQLKPFTDWFFTRQSGIQANLYVTGAPRYAVADFPTPIDTLCAMINERWPFGWVLGYTQSISMQFFATTPLPPLPVTVTVSFRLWQPAGTDEFISMTSEQAFAGLQAMGVDTSAYQNAPVGR